jgi:hypothetical protein
MEITQGHSLELAKNFMFLILSFMFSFAQNQRTGGCNSSAQCMGWGWWGVRGTGGRREVAGKGVGG